MNHHQFLIKEAVTRGKLMEIAKRYGLSTTHGDAMYAAKLLHKMEKAQTPAGKAHYGKVLGFTTPTERRILTKMLERGSSPWELFKMKMGLRKRQVKNPSDRVIGSAFDTVVDLINRKKLQGRTTFKGMESLEAGIHQPAGGARRLSNPGFGSTTSPKGITQRAVHTHPDPMAGEKITDMDDVFQMLRVSPSEKDIRNLTNPVMETGVVYGPRKAGKEWEAVYKGSKGKLRRRYYRGRE